MLDEPLLNRPCGGRFQNLIESIGNTSFTVRQVARNQRNAVVCEAKIVYVTLDTAGKPMPVPDEYNAMFKPWD